MRSCRARERHHRTWRLNKRSAIATPGWRGVLVPDETSLLAGLDWTEPVVRAEGVDFFYGTGTARNQVLFENGLNIRPGQLVVMTGPSGSGKTTLLTLIGALRSVQQGHINVLGEDLASLGPRNLVRVRHGIGFIFQLHNLFESLTAYENVKLGLQVGGVRSAAEMRQSAIDILERLGLGHRLNHKPHSLSGGQRQRVAIARALANPVLSWFWRTSRPRRSTRTRPGTSYGCSGT
jgi:ABC-type lipoprotein export system ATPase subunit